MDVTSPSGSDAAASPRAGRLVPDFLIVGTPRSGTTLVQRLASELPGVRVPPETHFLSLLAPELLARRPFPLDRAEARAEVRRFLALKTSQGLPVDEDAVLARLDDPVRSVLDLFAGIVTALCGEATLYGEKTPNHLLWWRPLSRALPGMRLVVVVRDPRAVLASYRAAWGPSSASAAYLAERWRSDQVQARRAQQALGPRRCLVLRFEDVVAAPDAARVRLGTFLGAPCGPDLRVVAPAELALPWEAWKRGAAGAVDPERADAWRGRLGTGEERVVLALAGREMARLGYLPAAPARRWAAATRLSLDLPSQRARLRFRARRARKLRRFERLGAALLGP